MLAGMRSHAELVAWLHARGGVAHTTALRDAGFTTHGIRQALRGGAAHWERRSWLALAGADPVLRQAAALGARTTCLTAAARAGLWTPAHDELHLSVPPTAARRDPTGVRLHWGVAPMPVARTTLIEPVINVLAHVAGCAAPADALCVWESALRKGAVQPGVLTGVRWRGSAQQLAALASVLSDSGLETRFVVLMRGLGVEVRQQVWIDGHPVDGLIGERLVVQLDGFAHHQGADRRRDLRADARLVLLGYTVLRFDLVQLLFHPDEVVASIATALAQQRHLTPALR